MNSRQGRKLLAGVGVMSMLLGALIVLVPATAGAEELPIVDKVTVCHRTNAVTNPYRIIEVAVDGSDGSLGNGKNDHTNHLGDPFDFENPGTYTPPFNGDDWGDIIPPYRWGPGEGQVFPGYNWNPEQSLELQCLGQREEPPVATTLTLVKQVSGSAAPATWSYTFDGLVDDVTLTHLASTSEAIEIDPEVTYEITESGTEGVVSASCAGAIAHSLDGRTLSVSVAEGEDATCTFTNRFEPAQTRSITVDKTNNADGSLPFSDVEQAPTAGVAVPFQVVISNTGNQPLTLSTLTDTWSGLAEPIDVLTVAGLACTRGGDAVTLSAGSTLPAGSVTTCTFSLPGYAPAAGGSRTNTVSVTTQEQVNGSDTSTVNGPTPPFIPPPPVVLPEPEVVPASVTVVKVVDGDEAAIPDDWEVVVDIDGESSPANVFLNSALGTATRGGLVPGVYELDELGDDVEADSDRAGVALTDISCVDADGADVGLLNDAEDLRAGVAVNLGAGDEVTCTFTNTYTAIQVLPEPPVEPTPAPQQPEPEVKGEVVTRTLPRTGDDSGHLAGFGAGLLLLGVGLVLTSRSRYARAD